MEEEELINYKNKKDKNFSQEIFLHLVKYREKGNVVTQSSSSYEELCNIWDDDINLRERFICLYLSRNNRVIGHYTVSVGAFNGTVVDPRLVFIPALLHGASAIILAHNHPSGNLTPSKADLDITKKIKDAGKMLDIPILDHIILTPEGEYTSLADEGLM